MAVIEVTRRFEFRAVHALATGPRPERRHGHLYHVEVTLDGGDDRGLDHVVRTRVLEVLHGRDLDSVTDGPSTGERLVEWIDERLRSSPLGPRLRAVRLRETAKNSFLSARSFKRYV